MISAACRQIIGGGGDGGAPINKSRRRRRRPQIVGGGGAARPAHGSSSTWPGRPGWSRLLESSKQPLFCRLDHLRKGGASPEKYIPLRSQALQPLSITQGPLLLYMGGRKLRPVGAWGEITRVIGRNFL